MRKLVNVFKHHLCQGTMDKEARVDNPFMQLGIFCVSGSYDPNVAPAKDEVLFIDEEKLLHVFQLLCREIYQSGKDVSGHDGGSLDIPDTQPVPVRRQDEDTSTAVCESTQARLRRCVVDTARSRTASVESETLFVPLEPWPLEDGDFDHHQPVENRTPWSIAKTVTQHKPAKTVVEVALTSSPSLMPAGERARRNEESSREVIDLTRDSPAEGEASLPELHPKSPIPSPKKRKHATAGVKPEEHNPGILESPESAGSSHRELPFGRSSLNITEGPEKEPLFNCEFGPEWDEFDTPLLERRTNRFGDLGMPVARSKLETAVEQQTIGQVTARLPKGHSRFRRSSDFGGDLCNGPTGQSSTLEFGLQSLLETPPTSSSPQRQPERSGARHSDHVTRADPGLCPGETVIKASRHRRKNAAVLAVDGSEPGSDIRDWLMSSHLEAWKPIPDAMSSDNEMAESDWRGLRRLQALNQSAPSPEPEHHIQQLNQEQGDGKELLVPYIGIERIASHDPVQERTKRRRSVDWSDDTTSGQLVISPVPLEVVTDPPIFAQVQTYDAQVADISAMIDNISSFPFEEYISTGDLGEGFPIEAMEIKDLEHRLKKVTRRWARDTMEADLGMDFSLSKLLK